MPRPGDFDGRAIADALYGQNEPVERRAPEPEMPPQSEHKRAPAEIKGGWTPEVTRTGKVQRVESRRGSSNRG